MPILDFSEGIRLKNVVVPSEGSKRGNSINGTKRLTCHKCDFSPPRLGKMCKPLCSRLYGSVTTSLALLAMTQL